MILPAESLLCPGAHSLAKGSPAILAMIWEGMIQTVKRNHMESDQVLHQPLKSSWHQGVYKHGRKEVWRNRCLPPTSTAFGGKKGRFCLGIFIHGFAFYAFLGPYETQTSKSCPWWCGHIGNVPSHISCGCVNSAVTCSSTGE